MSCFFVAVFGALRSWFTEDPALVTNQARIQHTWANLRALALFKIAGSVESARAGI